MLARIAFRSCLMLVAISLIAAVAQATTWNIDASWKFDAIASEVQPGDEVVIAPGDYYPSKSLYFTTPNITIRGSTGNCDDVRLHGVGMNVDAGNGRNNLIQFLASGFTIKDLTVQDVNQNGIQIHGEYGITSGNIVNVHLINIGERAIKGSGPVSQGQYDDANVTVANCTIEQTIPRSGYAASGDLDYIGGIDVMGTQNWVVRNNVFKNIQGATGGGRGGVFIWNGTNDTVENNVFIGCDRSICFGNPSSSFGPDHSIIRNNFIVRGADIGLELCSTDSVQVYNNTIYSPDASYGRTVSIFGSAANLVGENNLIRGAVSQSGGVWTSTNNIIGATVDPSWFVDPLNGDLHLTNLATDAIDHGIALSQVTADIDGQSRGSSPDIGADELVPEPASLTVLALGGLALLRRKKLV